MSDLVAAARDAYAAFAARDAERLRALCHPEVEIEVPTAALAGREGPYRGPEGIAAYLDDLSRVWDELELRPHEFAEAGDDRVVILGRVVTRRDRTRNDLPSVWVVEFRDGLVYRLNVFSDAAQVAAHVRDPS
jgi:ketosteroid isomerase-like protein